MGNKVKSVLIAVAFLIPAFVTSFLFVWVLAQIDYGPDPSREVAMTTAGTWALICGLYFKSKKAKIAGIFLLLLMGISLLSANT